jgi:hypothetical protein
VQFVSPNVGHDLARFCFGIGAQAPAAEILNKDRFFNLQTMKALVKSASKTMAWTKTKKAVVWGTVIDLFSSKNQSAGVILDMTAGPSGLMK